MYAVLDGSSLRLQAETPEEERFLITEAIRCGGLDFVPGEEYAADLDRYRKEHAQWASEVGVHSAGNPLPLDDDGRHRRPVLFETPNGRA